MDEKYIRSKPSNKWHIFATFTRMIGGQRSLCDRNFINPEGSTLVAEQDICKQCLRIQDAEPEPDAA